jgi:hypothetical protein
MLDAFVLWFGKYEYAGVHSSTGYGRKSKLSGNRVAGYILLFVGHHLPKHS